MDKQLTICLMLVIVVYGALIFAGRKAWLKPTELMWVGGAMVFWAGAELPQVVIPIVLAKYPAKLEAALISAAMVLPIIIALIVGLRYLIKKMRAQEADKV